MRVVLDADVLLSGVLTRGVCERVLDTCWDRAPGIVVVCSEHILREFADNAATKFGVPAEEVVEAVEKLRHRIELVGPSEVPISACRDQDDLPVLGTAMAGNAEYLVTGDGDLLTLKLFHDIPIVSPREFYNLIRGSG